MSWSIRLEEGRVLVEFRSLLLPVSLSPMDAAMMSVELAEASAAAGAGRKVYETRERRIATIEAARVPSRLFLGDIGDVPIGSPPLPPAGPSSSEDVEARPAAVGESERSIGSHATKRRRKR